MIPDLIKALEVQDDLSYVDRYLDEAPEGPYRELVESLVNRLRHAEGTLQDLRVDQLRYPIRMIINPDWSFEVDVDSPEWLDVFIEGFIPEDAEDEDDLEDEGF